MPFQRRCVVCRGTEHRLAEGRSRQAYHKATLNQVALPGAEALRREVGVWVVRSSRSGSMALPNRGWSGIAIGLFDCQRTMQSRRHVLHCPFWSSPPWPARIVIKFRCLLYMTSKTSCQPLALLLSLSRSPTCASYSVRPTT